MIDYELCIEGTMYSKKQVSLIDNVKTGKTLDYGDTSFQIFIARPNETVWDLCKRLHTTQEKLIEFNNDVPASYLGGEKIIIFR